MPTATLTESDRRALTSMYEARVRHAVPLCPRWLRRAIAERAVSGLSAALADPARSAQAQAAIAKALALGDFASDLKPLTLPTPSTPTTSPFPSHAESPAP